MKIIFREFLKYLPFGFGIAFSLLCIIYSVKCFDSDDYIPAALFFGIVGVPLLVTAIRKTSQDDA